MIAKTPKCLEGKPYPSFIKEHLIFKAYPEVEKVFPKIGLANCKEPLSSVIKSSDMANEAALNALAEVSDSIRSAMTYMRSYASSHYAGVFQSEGKSIQHILTSLEKKIKNEPGVFLVKKRGKISLRLPEDIHTEEFKLKKGECLFDALRKLNRGSIFGNTSHPRVSKNDQPKSPPKNAKIVFSSNNKDGLWDIATMSMRGISSCQRWSSTNHRDHLVGSMMDPFAGILYLTKGKTKLGSKMLQRAVVRLVFSRKTNKPALLIEQIYPDNSDNSIALTLPLFTKFLAKKTNNKFPILYGEEDGVRGYYIPLSEPVDYLDYESSRSYRDSGIGYKLTNKDVSKCIAKALTK